MSLLENYALLLALCQRSLWRRWQSMKVRCIYPCHNSFHRYGGRGITITPAWQAYQNFQQWAVTHGFRLYLTLDRINNDSNYTPENCRWITHSENCKNQAPRPERDLFAKTLVSYVNKETRLQKVVAAHIRPVLCVTTGITYTSRKVAALTLGCSRTGLSNCLAGRTKTCGQMEWRNA